MLRQLWNPQGFKKLVRVYLACCLLFGFVTGWYPYPFVHAGKLGYRQVLVNAAGLVLGLWALGFIVVAIDGAPGRRSTPSARRV